MILVDTSPLVGLVDPRDQWRPAAIAQLRGFGKAPRLLVTIPVMTEAWFILDDAALRRRLVEWLERGQATVGHPVEEAGALPRLWQWLIKYQDRRPDFADGYLATASLCVPRSRVWTFDRDFRTRWRRVDGSPIPLAAELPARSA